MMLQTNLTETLRIVTLALEVAGIAVIVVGAVVATALAAQCARTGTALAAYDQFRSGLGRAILLGLDLLIAADIISTVAIEPSLEGVAVLGGIILIRTFLSLSLEVEIERRWPWQGRASEGGS